MKYNKCEFYGCHHKATRKIKNGHYVCENCYRKLKHNHKVFKHNFFIKEVHIGNIGGYGIYNDIWIKYI